MKWKNHFPYYINIKKILKNSKFASLKIHLQNLLA